MNILGVTLSIFKFTFTEAYAIQSRNTESLKS